MRKINNCIGSHSKRASEISHGTRASLKSLKGEEDPKEKEFAGVSTGEGCQTLQKVMVTDCIHLAGLS